MWDQELGGFRAHSINVLTLAGDRVAAITAFLDGAIFPAFGLPEQPSG